MTDQAGFAVRMTIGGTAVSFLSHDIKETIEIVEDEGLRGVRTRAMERTAQGLIKVGGSITLQPSPVELAVIMPYFMNSSTGFLLTDAMQDVTVVIDNQTALYTYLGRFTAGHFSGEPGEKVTLKLDFVGYTLVIASGGTLSAMPDITGRPYMFYDMGSGITIGGTTYLINKFELSIDNKIVPTFMSGQTATDLMPTDRVVTLGIQTKYTSVEAGLLTTARTGPVIGSALAASIAFTDGAHTLTFTFGALVANSSTVTVQGRQMLRLPLEYKCYGVSTTKELVTTQS